MTLNCLACQSLPRVDSEHELSERCGVDKHHFVIRWPKVDRNWSGHLVPMPYEKGRNESGIMGKRAKSGHRRVHNDGPMGFENKPRLVRSSGMRRDWSFEDLGQRREMQEVEGH
ncbi:hypothetical protein ACSBR2_037528 [Camellia fascicularis]